jgi:hypothetical protein
VLVPGWKTVMDHTLLFSGSTVSCVWVRVFWMTGHELRVSRRSGCNVLGRAGIGEIWGHRYLLPYVVVSKG